DWSSMSTIISLLVPEADRKPPPPLQDAKSTMVAARISRPANRFIGLFFFVYTLSSGYGNFFNKQNIQQFRRKLMAGRLILFKSFFFFDYHLFYGYGNFFHKTNIQLFARK